MENARAIIRRLLRLVLVCVFLTTCPAQTALSNKEIVAQADEYMNALLGLGRFSGTVLIARDGQVLLSRGYGLANLEQDIHNTPQTKFRLGSVSKQFNAMAIMLLQQQGKLSVQDSVCKYVPACPNAWQQADNQLMFVKDKTGHVTHLLINWETQVEKIKWSSSRGRQFRAAPSKSLDRSGGKSSDER